MKYHCHIYRVTAKAEVDVDAETAEEARSKALATRTTVVFDTPDCTYIALDFRGENATGNKRYVKE